jgi:hypothetical protein
MTRVRPRHDPERTVRELRKRGWSDAKVKRSLTQKSDANQRRDARRTAAVVAALTEWVTFFKGAPTHARLKSIGVFYREDGRWLAAKDLRERRRDTSDLASLEPLVLARLEEGVLYEFSASR